MITFVTEVDTSEEFDDFIDNAFTLMCKSRNKARYKVEYDDEKQEMIFHYIDGTADRVKITQIEGYTTPNEFIRTGEKRIMKVNKN